MNIKFLIILFIASLFLISGCDQEKGDITVPTTTTIDSDVKIPETTTTTILPQQPKIPSTTECEVDEDCVKVVTECFSCSHNLESINVINKYHRDYWNNNLKEKCGLNFCTYEETRATQKLNYFVKVKCKEKTCTLDYEDYDVCKNQRSSGVVKTCYKEFAIKNENYKICEEIESSSDRDDCLGSVASTLSDPQICGKIENEKKEGSCFFGMATKTENVELCDEIKDEEEMWVCKERFGISKPTYEYLLRSDFQYPEGVIEIEGKEVYLVKVGYSNPMITISVDGVQETILDGETKIVNGLEITNIEGWGENPTEYHVIQWPFWAYVIIKPVE